MDREEMISKVTEWSSQLGLVFNSVDDPSADFHFVVSEPNIPPVEIVHQKIDSAYVLLASRVLVSEEDQKKMLVMEFKRIEEVLWDIRQKLLSMNMEFRIVSPSGGIPTVWEIHSKLFLEGANAQKFSDLYVKTKNAVLYLIWVYRRNLDLLK